MAGYVMIVSDAEPLPSISLSWSEGALILAVAAKVTNYDRNVGPPSLFSSHWMARFPFQGKDRVSSDSRHLHVALGGRSS